MTPDRTVQAVVLLNAVEERITELLRWRQWYRRERWADWPDIRKDNDTELRALLKLARQARKVAAAAPDPIDVARWNAERLAPEGELERAGARG